MSDLFTTERLSVRKFTPDDHEDLAEILTDPEVTYFEPYETFTKEKCVEEAVNFSNSEEFFAVVLGNKVIGKIYFSKKDFGSFEIGWTFNAGYQGKGYAFESVRGMIDYAFSALRARRIFAEINTGNAKSVRLAERLGMSRTDKKKGLYPRKEDESVFDDFYFYELRKKDMCEKKKTVVSRITLVIMIIFTIIFVIFTIPNFDIMISLWSFWTKCIAALFLGEWLCGLIKKRFASNIGVLAVDTIMAVLFVVPLLQSFSENDVKARAFLYLFFLPPLTISLAVNIGNVIYKIKHGKTENG